MGYQNHFLFAMYILYPLVKIESMTHCLLLVDEMLRVSNNCFELLDFFYIQWVFNRGFKTTIYTKFAKYFTI